MNPPLVLSTYRMPLLALLGIWIISKTAAAGPTTRQYEPAAAPTKSGYPFDVPRDSSFLISSSKNPHQEPILIHITNVVSPQVTSNSNAISSANGPSSPMPDVSSYSKIPFLSGASLIPFTGEPNTVKVVYIPVLVPLNTTDRLNNSNPVDGRTSPSDKFPPGGVDVRPQSISEKVQPDLVDSSVVPRNKEAPVTVRQWSFPENDREIN
ncbi:hypothetical protein BV898_05631 [Hypsibius exemplaris]|uniref:Uncharacterized protein n=1 Tax=Hypsibius exemplaris TaxID=2072580 RepID=A0A1W0WYV5_HYPEX|nr:hypothetical protein BV898_05631 [Hypsibius exemplaris]